MKEYTAKEYINTLLSQLRSRKARELIEPEIKNHIEEQIQDFKNQGMAEEAAETAAIKEMGDPVETGIALDRIHRPKISLSMLFLMAVITLFSILAQSLMAVAFSGSRIQWIRHLSGCLAGFTVMLCVCWIDYSRIARYARQLTVCLFILLLAGLRINSGLSINGLFSLSYLYVPLYGALLFSFRGQKLAGIIKALLWAVVPSFLILQLSSRFSLVLSFFYSLMLLLSLSVKKGWFSLKKIKVFLCGMWAALLAGPLLLLILSFNHLKDSYRGQRILSFLRHGEKSYLSSLLLTAWQGCRFRGQSRALTSSTGFIIPNYESDYAITALASAGGIFACILAGLLMLLLIMGIFWLCARQKNQLGEIMGYGCGLILLLQTAMHIGVNLGLIPIMSSTLPFFSYGTLSLLVSYGLMGIVLSIYRYQSLLKAPAAGITIN